MHSRHLILAVTVLLVLVSPARAGHFFCKQCGCQRHCKKVCRLVCEKKKETKTEYACECEDFCIPGHSKKCGVKIECDCHGHRHRKIIWQPVCAKVHTRKKLVKKEVTKEVPSYKWVVEEYCCICGQCVKIDRDAKPEKEKAKAKKAERLPIPLADGEQPEMLAPEAASGDYHAYFLDAQPEEPQPDSGPRALCGDSECDEAEIAMTHDEPVHHEGGNQPHHEPRRLFRGLIRR